jgi:ATP-dependent Lon protease
MMTSNCIPPQVLAAHRSGVQRVLLPRRNEKDVHDLAPEVIATDGASECSYLHA